jgi:hypothetical protein
MYQHIVESFTIGTICVGWVRSSSQELDQVVKDAINSDDPVPRNTRTKP